MIALAIATAAAIPATVWVLHPRTKPGMDTTSAGGSSVETIQDPSRDESQKAQDPKTQDPKMEGPEGEDLDIIPDLYVDRAGNTLNEIAYGFYSRGYHASDPQLEASSANWTLRQVYTDEQRSACRLILEGVQDQLEGLPPRYVPATRARVQ